MKWAEPVLKVREISLRAKEKLGENKELGALTISFKQAITTG